MKSTHIFMAVAASVGAASAGSSCSTSLADVCSVANAQAALPADGTFNGITINVDSVTVNAVYNQAVEAGSNFPAGVINYCNITFSYSHDGADDTVLVQYWMPAPGDFTNRFLATGGGAYSINGQGSNQPGGLLYGAASGMTDGGFGGFDVSFDTIVLLGNGTINWPAVYMFGYQAIKEMTAIGKVFTSNFFSVDSSAKLYSYYQGCSEGGREGWSQIQQAGDLYDGLVVGAPAMRYGQQQANHLFPAVLETNLSYFPPPCELEKIVNLTIAFCDPLDGKTDGVISRSDLCLLQFDLNSTIGEPYYCAAGSSGAGGGVVGPGKRKRQSDGSTTPAQNGTVSAEGAALAKALQSGLHDSLGRKAYIYFQPGASFGDASTSYNSSTGTWTNEITTNSAEWITKFLNLQKDGSLSLDELTPDVLRDYMVQGMELYWNSLQTTLPDLTPFYENGGKVIHFHGEQDSSVPTGSSAHWYESVRSIMYAGISYNESVAAMSSWYRFFPVPGAAHCGPNSAQPNGPFPQAQFASIIDWVENGIEPVTLNATFLAGDYEGDSTSLCSFPLRPYWSDPDSLVPDCVYDQASIDSWTYDLNAFKMPIY
ncbi:hypothetical protein SBRCBS47491_001824 [Sporothrix bragantina]|uniref:Carboxylic ester hydrolase n=1 Tax=Sporothrix bragantina TaxID=671064 RepID=A0ABP0B2G6_9PEZI